MFYNARWYDSALGRFLSPDTIIPNPYNPQAFDRFSYVLNNPIRFTDPSGHCIEGSDDFIECMRLVRMIEGEWKNVNVVTCAGGEVVDGCKGWTAEEVRLLYGALGHNPNDVSKTRLTLIRQVDPVFPNTNIPIPDSGIAADTFCPPGTASCNLTFYDFAWNAGPSANWVDTQLLYLVRSEGAFLGALLHELTHAAVYQDPSILDEWVSDHPNGDNRVGQYYNWRSLEASYSQNPDGLERAKQEETMAMSTAVDVTGWLSRNIFVPYQPPWN